MKIIALTGGIAAGKTTVAKLFRECGAALIDADVLARAAVAEGTPGHAAVLAEFGADIIGTDGELDRRKLGTVVFASAAKRRALEAIVHPEVKRLFALHATELKQREVPVCVYEIPLLVESGQQHNFDGVVVVVADKETRLRRLTIERGLSAEMAAQRLAAQVSDEARIAIANWVVPTDVNIAQTRQQVQQIWQQITAAPYMSARGVN
ncbi:dephospho-CoA kinase [Canibacter sp. lx-45]|uniref:dephospho-CoA kinase n=1 Tax=Canibacter zhuwentaonis TaxID=2837491 RepID=UPI001BDD85B7|nr:dephospho-CoA kinase [Canibacter zhuwentaonis]MBT1034864.1 dephospho-CoA kinase [Canibacter zhuwentaonis]